MTSLFRNTLLAVIPAILLVIHFYRRNRQKPEPKALIVKTFFLGFLIVLPAALLEWGVSRWAQEYRGVFRNLVEAFIVVALVEEGLKLVVVKLFLFNRKEFSTMANGLAYTITASLGFACFENIMHSFGSPLILIIRGFTAVPLHAFASGIMGYCIGKARYFPGHWMLRGLTAAVVIHGLYDFFLFTGGWMSLFVLPLLALSGIQLIKLNRRALEEDRRAGRS